jgi:hypothetical protein
MKRLIGVRAAVCLTLLAAFSITLTAVPITGTVNITGSAGVSANVIDFFGNMAQGCSISNPLADGCFLTNVPKDGSFTTLVAGQPGGVIKDLQGPPISGNISLSQFISFVNGVFFDLTRVVPGGAPDCATVNTSAPNIQCTPIIGGQVSPFVLTNSSNATNASVFFNVELLGYTGTVGSGATFYVGAFNTPSAGKNIAGILEDVSAGRFTQAAYSANFVGSDSPIPEPSTWLMFSLGLAAVVFGGIRRNKRA